MFPFGFIIHEIILCDFRRKYILQKQKLKSVPILPALLEICSFSLPVIKTPALRKLL